MPYVTVPRDLSKVKAKVLLGLTKRQIVCFGSAALIGIPICVITMSTLGAAGVYFAAIPVVPLFVAGIYRPRDNRPIERKVMDFIRVRFLLPRTRPYRTENFYRKLELQYDIEEVLHDAEARSHNTDSR